MFHRPFKRSIESKSFKRIAQILNRNSSLTHTSMESPKDTDADNNRAVETEEVPVLEMTERERKLYILKQKMQLSRKANQEAIVEESRKKKLSEESGHQSDKKKWFEERKKRQAERLKELGLPPEKVCRIETAEVADAKYKKKEKKEAAFGWDVFNQSTLYKAYEKRADKVMFSLQNEK